MKKVSEKIKNIVIIALSICTLVGTIGGYFCGYAKGTNKMSHIQEKVDKAKAVLDALINNVGNETKGFLNKIAEQDEIIQRYEYKEKLDAVVVGVREVNIKCFQETRVKICYDEETPIAIVSKDYQLNPKVFGNLTDIHEEFVVKYYYGLVADKINVKSNNKEVTIAYDRDAFMNPYIIESRNSSLNLGAKVLTNIGDDKTDQIVNQVGDKLLSDNEDAYLRTLKAQYANSEIPVVVNGVKLEDWNENCKVFTTNDPIPENIEYSLE